MSQKKQNLVALITLVIVIGLIVGGVYGGRMLWGSDVGGKCDEDFSCKPGNMCISKRCRQKCKADGDCQAGWMCRPTEVTVSGNGEFKFDSVKICFSPEAMRPVLEREHEKAMAEKRADVRRQTIVLLVVTPPQLTDGEFDGAWARIPAAERESSTVGALAQRVVALARPK